MTTEHEQEIAGLRSDIEAATAEGLAASAGLDWAVMDRQSAEEAIATATADGWTPGGEFRAGGKRIVFLWPPQPGSEARR